MSCSFCQGICGISLGYIDDKWVKKGGCFLYQKAYAQKVGVEISQIK